MVANFRCNEIKKEAVELAQPHINDLVAVSEKQILPDF